MNSWTAFFIYLFLPLAISNCGAKKGLTPAKISEINCDTNSSQCPTIEAHPNVEGSAYTSGQVTGEKADSDELQTSASAASVKSFPELDALFREVDIQATPVALSCFERNVPIGAVTGDNVCNAVGASCVRVIGSSGFQTLHCSTFSQSGNVAAYGPTWSARCCALTAGTASAALPRAEQAVVPTGFTGDGTCATRGSQCIGVVGNSGLQSLSCSVDPTVVGNAAQNFAWSARCIQATPTLSCTNIRVPRGTTGDNVCGSVGRSCMVTLGSSGNQSLYCGTDPSNGDNTQNNYWEARCCAL